MNDNKCDICPRSCNTDRASGKVGYCGVGSEIKIARAALHAWEEPPISGKNGSGAIFFSGCNLRCVYCQNYRLSHEGFGKKVSSEELEDIIFGLEDMGAENINLVTPTQYSLALVKILSRVKPRLKIPVVWNSSGYESVETLKMFEGLVDIYLPDFKYSDCKLADQYSGASDYPSVAEKALVCMFDQVGSVRFNDSGMITGGMIVRHLVLPGCRKHSIETVKRLAEILPVNGIRLSLMSQYTPDFAMDCKYKNLKRKVTTFEYRSVLQCASELDFEGYFQGKESADSAFTPEFFGKEE